MISLKGYNLEFLKFLERNKVRISAIAGAVISNSTLLGVPDNIVKFVGAVFAVVVVTNVSHVMIKDKY